MTFRFPFALRYFCASIIVAVTIGIFVGDAAGQGATEFRTWTSKAGSHQVRAKLVDRQGDQLTLQLTDGRTVTLGLTQLSLADQNYVRGQGVSSSGLPVVPNPGDPLVVPPNLRPPNLPPVNPPVEPADDPAVSPPQESDAQRKAKIRDLLMRLSRGRAEDRAAVAEEMVDYPTEEVISALALRGLKADEAVVRSAVIRTLLTHRDDPAMGATLLTAMKRQTRVRDGQLVVVPGLAILLSSRSQVTEKATVDFISKSINDTQMPQVAMLLYDMLDLKTRPSVPPPMGFQQPGMMGLPQQGMPGMQQPGMQQPGMPGMQQPGMQQPGGGWPPQGMNQPQPGGGLQPPGLGQQQQPAAGDGLKLPPVATLFDDEAKARILRGLTMTRQYMSSFTFRRTVVQVMVLMNTRDSVPVLIDALQRTRGEVRGDIVSHLQAVTTKKFGANVKLWQGWWAEVADSFTMPVVAVQGGIAKLKAEENQASYYGLPLYAERVLFVLDASGSMHDGGRINRAKKELGNAIMKLGPNCYFSIIVFNEGTDIWKRTLMPATPASKQSAANYVRRIFPMGGTETRDALQEAFKFDVEAIYLLSDGMPSGNPMRIIQDVTAANRGRMISIYTIGMGMPPNTAGGMFLQQLSAQNHGTYVSK